MVSRVAKNPVEIPTGVEVKLTKQTLTVKGKLGQLSTDLPALVRVTQVDNLLQFEPANEQKKANALTGTNRALINNMVHGVHQGFERRLVMMGVGYRAKAEQKKLNLTVGLSHPVNMTMPEGVSVETPSPTEIIVKGVDKQLVNQVAANIRAVRPPEPYKGKGIRYHDEHVVRKEGKKK